MDIDSQEGDGQQMVPDDHDRPFSPSRNVFIVCGMPGIGKSYFLYYVLVERLLARLPTCLQTEPDYFIYWHAMGLSRISMTEFGEILPDNVWFLVDSNQDNVYPRDKILHSGARTLQATPSRANRLNWIDKLDVQPYQWYMKPSPVRELLMMYAAYNFFIVITFSHFA
ncbi:hypothetical protein E1B28_012569 [Marasmius oreades]|uniref:Uncharacterized protein n=1 Tax=Marasmius oreades TaxID=181124 RepID=A0A9P7UQX9_9AGAR|nr:uncharacterized protein E1B28_012569 [Marasmius oreades]KAG7088594.1 hypothetical protein E1B28_012569 [Marasmius oreades]